MACYSDLQMAAALRKAGVSAGDAAFLVATAHPESGGCGVIQQGQPYSTTGWGVWQITPGNSEPQFGVNNQLLSLWPNAEAAAAKLRSQGLGAWTTITSGLYSPYLGSAKSAVQTVYNLSAAEVNKLVSSAPQGGSKAQTTAFGGGLGNLLNPGLSLLSPGDWVNGILQQFGIKSPRDAVIRLGLVILGFALVIVGLVVLTGMGHSQITNVIPEAGGGSSGGSSAGTESSPVGRSESKSESKPDNTPFDPYDEEATARRKAANAAKKKTGTAVKSARSAELAAVA